MTENKRQLPAASDAWNSNDASEMTKKHHAAHAEDWSNGDVKATIAVQEDWVRAI